jgi:tRNA pseudouridine55 synthase
VRRTIEDRFLGKVTQVPPAYSAVKVGGERAYRKMRQGRGVGVLPSREVQISACKILSYEYPRLCLRVACSSGTYIRSLAHDLGTLLRSGGYLAALRRTKVGDWSVDAAVLPAKALWTAVIPLKEVMKGFPGVELTAEEADDLQHGRDIAREVKPETIGWFQDLPIAVLIPAKDGTRQAHARKVL